MSETTRILENARQLVASGWSNVVARDVSGREVEPTDVSARRFGLLGALVRVSESMRLKNRKRSFAAALNRLGQVANVPYGVDVIEALDRSDRDKRAALRLLDRALQG